MSLINKFFITLILILFPFNLIAEEVKKIGKFKDWETMVLSKSDGIVCFAQSKPVLQSPKNNKRDSRLFVTFRPGEKIVDEISITAGYEFNKQNSITAKSGKFRYKFDISQQNFAWIADNKVERKMIRTMKKGSRLMISGYNSSGSQTIDHYSLLGFTKAYNEAKKSCS
ncbi:MAG: invasion associated locus B family protein [Candidatus Pelagibacter sp.]|tara:strand:+ start:639 stop:1145 length:507 start_codon:yes stop_codon:yes gene_type:complete